MAGSHRADFEWERDQKHKLMAEFLKMIAVTMTAKEAAARLEGELAALKARPSGGVGLPGDVGAVDAGQSGFLKEWGALLRRVIESRHVVGCVFDLLANRKLRHRKNSVSNLRVRLYLQKFVYVSLTMLSSDFGGQLLL